jgi:regulatory protein
MSFQRNSPPEALLSAALRLLAARQRGVEELRGRLRKKGFTTKEVSNCLEWLKERDLLDDEAFSRALVRDRLNFSPRGAATLKMELTRKGISRDVADVAVQTVLRETENSDMSLAEEAARRWVRKQGEGLLRELTEEEFSPSREKARRRLYGFLARRGFRGGSARSGLEVGIEASRNLLSTKD